MGRLKGSLNKSTIAKMQAENKKGSGMYNIKLEKAVEGKNSIDEVLQELQNGDLPMSLTSYMLIDKYLNHD